MSTRGRGGAGLELAAAGAEVPCSRSAVVLVVPLETTIAYGATNGAAEWNKGTVATAPACRSGAHARTDNARYEHAQRTTCEIRPYNNT